ncbi:MAG: sigma-70 family RNA polymerase sigma factor [Oscillospiraceae bacterium]|nr:sigma-70 family RNA polymerase sigma factor [Oscillospiraceae bacterium]
MDQHQFAQRLETLRPRLFRIALLYFSGSEATALDVVDEAVYRGLCSLKKLRQPEFFETWMTRILINECHREEKRRRRFRSVEELPEETAEVYDRLPLKEALANLPPDLKEVILLRYFAGYTQEETAKALDRPRTTILSYQRRALALLRLELGEEE